MLQQDRPDDFVCSAGVSNTVEDLVAYAFKRFGLHGQDYITQDPKFLRPEELEHLRGDCSKAQRILGWKHEYTFESMLDEMLEEELKKYQ